MNALVKQHPTLSTGRNFDNSVFPTATFNLGPQTVTLEHLDSNNLAFGWCAVTALGNFDHKHGGHLVLPDLKLIITLPVGATILLPSAILRHGNIPIGSAETRMSFTQYASGGLFRWVDAGFMTSANMSAKARQQLSEEAPERFKEGLMLFSCLPALESDRSFAT